MKIQWGAKPHNERSNLARSRFAQQLRSACLLLLVCGCLPLTAHTTSAQSKGELGEDWNRHIYLGGYDVLCSIFDKAGHTVDVTSDFDDVLKDSEVILWAPGDFSFPNTEQQTKLAAWLAGGGDRVLVYVAHDFDAEAAYWSKLYRQDPTSPAADKYERNLEDAMREYAKYFEWANEYDSCRWFGYDRTNPAAHVYDLAGPWSVGIDARSAEIEIRGRLVLRGDAEASELFPNLQGTVRRLLACEEGTLAAEIRPLAGGRVIAVANESFLCNLGLVNHENRKLAGKLSREIGSRRKIVFYSEWYSVVQDLEGDGGEDESSGAGGGSSQQPNSEMSFLKAWPLNFILLHLLALGIILCIALSPIFGRARKLPAAETADFGRHLNALGDLLSRSGDRKYAEVLIEQFQTSQRQDGRRPAKG